MPASPLTLAPQQSLHFEAFSNARRLLLAVGVALCGLSCSPSPQSSSSTHWLTCTADTDCNNSVLGALCNPDGFCAGPDRKRLELKLTLQEEFDSATLDPQVFGYETGTAVRNDEAQAYTSRPENVRVEDGSLVITALAESYDGADYTSASVSTQNRFSFTFGRLEARIMAPLGRGCSTSLWMRPEDPGANVNSCDINEYCVPSDWPAWGDITVANIRSDSPPEVLVGLNYGIWDDALNGVTHGVALGSATGSITPDSWHIYAMNWGPQRIDWWVDNVVVRSISLPPKDAYLPEGENPFHRAFYLQLNLALGGLAETPVASDYPQQMRVDWVRVWQWEALD
jgi:beta-glucanase (GH16 family)